MNLQDQNQKADDTYIVHPAQIKGNNIKSLNARDIFHIIQHKLKEYYKELKKSETIQVVKVKIQDPNKEINPWNFNNQLEHTINFIRTNKSFDQQQQFNIYNSQTDPYLNDLFKDALLINKEYNDEDNKHITELTQTKFLLTEEENLMYTKIQEFVDLFSTLCKKFEEFENLDPEQQKKMVQNLNDYIINPKNFFMPNTLRQVKDSKRQIARQQIQQIWIDKGEKNEEEGKQRRNIFVDIIGKQSTIMNLKILCDEKNKFKIRDPMFDKDYSQISVENTPILYFNFQNKQQYPQSHSEDLIYKIQKEDLEVFNWSLGYLHGPPNEEEFINYFTTSGFQEVLNISEALFTIKSNMIFYPNIKNKSKKIEIISQLFNNFEIKLEFSIKYIQDACQIYDEKTQRIILYFRLLTPPQFYINYINPNLYNNPQFYDKEWIRLPNFTVVDQDNIDEFARLHFINNSILRIDISDAKENVDPLIKFMNDLKDLKLLLQTAKKTYTKKKEDQFKIYNHKQFDYFSNFKQFSNSDLDFEIKYLIMVAISQNKLCCIDQIEQGQHVSNITSLLNFIDQFQQKCQMEEQQFKNMIIQALITTIKTLKQSVNSKFCHYFKYFLQKVQEQNNFKIDQIDLNQYKHISFIRRIQFTPSGLIYNLKEPEMDNRLLRQFSDMKDFFLRCHFLDDDHSYPRNMKYVTSKFFRKQLDQLNIIDRKYTVLAWSSSQIKSASCWCYFETPEIRSKNHIIKEMGDFQNIKIAAKKAARIGQCLSSSIPIHFTAQIQIIYQDDVVSLKDNKKVFSDGIGLISLNLIQEIQIKLRKVKLSAIQMRLMGAKGVLSLDPSLQDNSIVLRPSQIKYESNYPVLEILDTNKYRAGYLNRQIIILLLSLDVNPAHFIELQQTNLKQLEQISLKDSCIYKYFNAEYNGDIVNISPITKTLRQLLRFNADFENDPFITGVIKTLKTRAYYTLRKKSNILVEKSARLIGVLDEYGVLEEDEIYCSIQEEGKEQFEVEGKVMITKNPCLHCGDIRVVKAVTSNTLEQRNGSNKLQHFINTVVFPQKGDVPITCQISGGDLDGDLFFITWDERLIPPKTVQAFDYTPPKQIDEKDQINEKDMLDFFVDYMNFENLGKIDNSHLAKADQSDDLALDPDCVKLAEYHSAAVDFAKTGYCPKIDSKYFAKQYPDFMERKNKENIYESKTVLGKLYREVKEIVNNQQQSAAQNENIDQNKIDKKEPESQNQKQSIDKIKIDPNFIFLNPDPTNNNQEINFSVNILKKYCEDMYSEQCYFGFQNEFEVYTGNFSKFVKEHKQKRLNKEQNQKRILNRIVQIKKYYEQIFFKNMELDYENFNNQQGKFSNKAKFRATLWYLLSYLYSYPINQIINFDQIDYDKQQLIEQIYTNKLLQQLLEKKATKEQKFIGLAWFIIPDVLIQIRKDYFMKEANSKIKVNINENSEEVAQDLQDEDNIFI